MIYLYKYLDINRHFISFLNVKKDMLNGKSPVGNPRPYIQIPKQG